MEAALFRAAHDTNLLRTRLDRILGENATRLSKNDAQRAILFILAEGSGHRDMDLEKTILLGSSVATSSFKISHEETSDCSMDVDNGAVGEGSQASVASPPSENLRERDTQERLDSRKCLEQACKDDRLHDNQLDDHPMVDRKRLVEILTAEERVNIMVNHLGSSDTAWLDMRSKYSSPTKGVRTGSVGIPNVAVGFLPLRVPGAETANEGRRQGEFVPSPKGLIGGGSVMFEMMHGRRGADFHRRKKKRTSERQACVGDPGRRRERGTLVGNVEQPGTTGMSMLSRSGSSAVGEEPLPGPGGGGEHTGEGCSSLPRLDVSRLNG